MAVAVDRAVVGGHGVGAVSILEEMGCGHRAHGAAVCGVIVPR